MASTSRRQSRPASDSSLATQLICREALVCVLPREQEVIRQAFLAVPAEHVAKHFSLSEGAARPADASR